MKILRKYLSWWVGAVLSLILNPAHATMVTVDPGAIGGPSNGTILIGGVLTPSDPMLDIVFADMKHIVATQWDVALTDRVLPIVPILDPPVEVFGFLTNELGQEIINTQRSCTLSVPVVGPSTTGCGFSLSGVPLAHGISFNSTNLSQDLAIDVRVFGQVGVWGVPEPTTLALVGLGLAGIGAARRRKKLC